MEKFKINSSSKNWFANIQQKRHQSISVGLDLDFDILYLCFIAGIAEKRKREFTSDSIEIIDYFPGRYKQKAQLILGLFLKAELDEFGINMSKREDVHKVISKLVEPQSSNYLSELGMKEFNKYVNGGYEVLSTKWFDAKPFFFDAFLIQFNQKLTDSLKDEK